MVLWIGYLQWHFRTHGSVKPPEPVLRDFRNLLEQLDAHRKRQQAQHAELTLTGMFLSYRADGRGLWCSTARATCNESRSD